RVTLESIGHAIVGDPVHGAGGAKRVPGPGARKARQIAQSAPRQALHAALLAFRHPISGEPLRFRSPWPADLVPLLAAAVPAETWHGQGDPLTHFGFDQHEQ